MARRIFCCIYLLMQSLFAQGIGVVSEAQRGEADLTIVEFIVDTNSVDRKLGIDLKHLQIHGTTSTASSHITFYSNQKVARLPAVLTLPNGKYSFNANNSELSTSFVVDARGGYQQWLVNSGNHEKVNNIVRYGFLPAGITFMTGGIVALVAGLAGIDDYMLDSERENLERYGNSYSPSEIREAEERIEKLEKERRSRRAWRNTGFTAMGVSIAAVVPLRILGRRHVMNAKMVESRDFVPEELLHQQGESQ